MFCDMTGRSSRQTPGLPGAVAPSSLDSGGQGRSSRIVMIEDEPEVGELLEQMIHMQFSTVTILRFQNRDTAWQELLRADPDLLITDMNNDNIPGRQEYLGMSGWTLLPLLAKREVHYPIFVVSGSFAIPGVESHARRCAGPGLNVTFLTKPFTAGFFNKHVAQLLRSGGECGRRLPTGGP
jgi:DNA-binding NtrC family response regulator